MRRQLPATMAVLVAVGGLGVLTAGNSTGFSPTSNTPTAQPEPQQATRQSQEAPNAVRGGSDRYDGPGPKEFYFTRAAYSGVSRGGGFFGRGSWATDYPKADRQFMVVVQRLTNIDLYDDANPIRLDDPDLRRFPFLYALEVGYMRMSPPEVEGLRSYLNAGGFLVIDDFWGTYEWANFEYQMRLVFPDKPIVELPMDHPLFDTFYEIEEVIQVPARRRAGGYAYTYERDGITPHARGIFDDHGRLMVLINWNTDLGDAWEWAEHPYYPLRFSTYAFEMGVNMIVYGMSH